MSRQSDRYRRMRATLPFKLMDKARLSKKAIIVELIH